MRPGRRAAGNALPNLQAPDAAFALGQEVVAVLIAHRGPVQGRPLGPVEAPAALAVCCRLSRKHGRIELTRMSRGGNNRVGRPILLYGSPRKNCVPRGQVKRSCCDVIAVLLAAGCSAGDPGVRPALAATDTTVFVGERTQLIPSF